MIFSSSLIKNQVKMFLLLKIPSRKMILLEILVHKIINNRMMISLPEYKLKILQIITQETQQLGERHQLSKKKKKTFLKRMDLVMCQMDYQLSKFQKQKIQNRTVISYFKKLKNLTQKNLLTQIILLVQRVKLENQKYQNIINLLTFLMSLKKDQENILFQKVMFSNYNLILVLKLVLEKDNQIDLLLVILVEQLLNQRTKEVLILSRLKVVTVIEQNLKFHTHQEIHLMNILLIKNRVQVIIHKRK